MTSHPQPHGDLLDTTAAERLDHPDLRRAARQCSRDTALIPRDPRLIGRGTAAMTMSSAPEDLIEGGPRAWSTGDLDA
jgi:hypothetical protein